MGNALRYSDNLYQTWAGLEEALRGGSPALAAETYLGADTRTTRDFVYGMHDRAIGIGAALAEIVDLGGRTSLLDVGGGPGTYSAMLVRKNPGLSSTVLELPGVAAVAREILADMRCDDRVSLLPGDYLSTPFPKSMEAVLISGVFHRESEDNCRALIGKAYDCLADDGLLIVSDVFTDAGGTAPTFATLFGINMMLTAPDGGVHADADVAAWMRQAGFGNTRSASLPPPMPHRVVTGSKT
jgi:cyclopropane fatty-acyl-phospholipid synthase-like methyltransferase